MLTSQTFIEWRENNPFIEQHLFFREGTQSRWARLHLRWEEKRRGAQAPLSHLFASSIDLKTGDLYTDCSKRLIWFKCVALTFTRPIWGMGKTIYHLSLPISLPIEIGQAIAQGIRDGKPIQEIAWGAWTKAKHNFADCIRTPFYTAAMTATVLAAVVIGPLCPQRLYDFRALSSRLELGLNRSKASFWTLAPCFQPIIKIQELHLLDYSKDDTVYSAEPTLHGGNNFARNYIKHIRNPPHLFSLSKIFSNQNYSYISPAAI